MWSLLYQGPLCAIPTPTEGAENKDPALTEGAENEGPALTEGAENEGPAAQQIGILCSLIKNKVKANRSLKDVTLQLQANMCIASVLALRKAFHERASTLSNMETYDWVVNACPLKLFNLHAFYCRPVL